MAHKIGKMIGYFCIAFLLVTIVWGGWLVIESVGLTKITLVSLMVAAILAVWGDDDGT